MRQQVIAAVVLAIITCALFASAARAAATSARDLIGVWTSEREFGPQLSSDDVELRRTGTTWSATIAQRSATSQGRLSSSLSFRFSDGNDLHVRGSGGDLLGQWVQPATVSTGYRFATPVNFVQVEDDVWSGTVHPLHDVANMWLTIQAQPDGLVSAFLRNPENNDGGRWGTRTVVLAGNEVHLQCKGTPDIVGHLINGGMSIEVAGYEGSFIFQRTSNTSITENTAIGQPLRTGDGWQTGSLDDVGLDRAKINALVAIIRAPATSAASPFIQSLQIARHDELVVDEYFNGFSIDRPHDVRSAGKSITTLLVGRIIGDGAPIAPDTRIAPLFVRYEPLANDDTRKQAITIADLMTMSSGYACDDNDDASPGNEDTMESQRQQPDWYKYTVDLPMAYDPGSKAVYCSAGINLLGAIVARQTKLSLEDYFYDRFAAPMQFGPYAMWLQPPPMNAPYMAGGDYFLPRDFLKFGELFLDHGQWNGRPIIADAWLEASAQSHAALNAPGDYGYGWHLYTYSVNGRSVKAISAGGNGGQLLFVFPQLDMTVMITAANYGQYPVWQKFITELVPNYILTAAK